MDFKSTIFIFGLALIFMLPLVISSPVSKGIYQKKRAIDLEEVLGEEAKERVKRGGTRAPKTPKPKREPTEGPTKQPGSQGDIKARRKDNHEYLGGGPNEWHIHKHGGKNPHIKFGDNASYYLVQNRPDVNKRRAKEALEELDRLVKTAGHNIPNYDLLRGEIEKIIENGHV